MIRLIKIVFILTIFAIGLSNCQTVFANEYKVKPVILVPKEWQSNMTQDKLEKYKAGILNGLKVIQEYYSKNLLGKTFDYEESVDVIFSNRFSTTQKAKYSSDIFFQAEGELLIPSRPKTIYAVWQIGSGNLVQGAFGAGIIPKVDGIAVLNHEDILRLAGPDGIERNNTIGILGHELGHTFGLVSAGYAKIHPCTQISKDQCTDNAPQPLPDQIEYTNSIMGSGWNISESILTNTPHNPVIYKAFQSPFINPTADPAPKPTSPSQRPSISTIKPETAIVESEVEINGRNFGQKKGRIILVLGSVDRIEIKNISFWSDSAIKFTVPKEASSDQGLSTVYTLKVITQNDQLAISNSAFNIKPKPVEFPPINLSLKIKTTCGEEPNIKPLPDQEVQLQQGHLIAISKVLTTVTSDNNGRAQIDYQAENVTSVKALFLIIKRIYGIPAPKPFLVTLDIPQNTTTSPIPFNKEDITFHYPECPLEKDIKLTAEVDQKFEEELAKEVKEEETVTPAGLVTSEPNQIIISNYEDFREVNDEGDLGSTAKTERYQRNQTINWTASTHLGDPKVYVQVIYQNKQPENYSIEVDTEETVTQIGEMELRIKRVLPKISDKDTDAPEQPVDRISGRTITKVYLASVTGDYLADLYEDGEYFDPEVDITEANNQFKIIRCFSDLSCDDPNLAKVVNLAVEPSQAARQSDQPDQPTQEEPTKQPPVEQPSEEAPPPQPIFSHRTCGDVSGNVIVDVYSDGSEIAGTNCQDLDQVCTLTDNEGVQDATCVDRQ